MAEHGAASAQWRKSSRSLQGSSECVEVAIVGGEALVRDSKDQEGGVLRFSAESWSAFIAAVRMGEMDCSRLAKAPPAD